VGLLLAFYLFEGAAAGSALTWYKFHGRLSLAQPRPLAALLLATTPCLVSLIYLVLSYRRGDRADRRKFILVMVTNLIVVVPLLLLGEIGVRVGTRETPLGASFAGTVLLPRSWPEFVRRNEDLLAATPKLAYYVPDTLLGWTVGRSRSAFDGMYQSSIEGIRSPQSGSSYRTLHPSRWVAAVGDSYTFGMEGPWEDSWVARLDSVLGPETRILNFGVDGFGVDQAYLRYQRDARPWKPAVVIFGFINHDLARSLSVYTNLSFPGWGYPFSKPRFRLVDGNLEQLNSPVYSAEQIIRTRTIGELPLIEYEPGYNPDEWEPHWYLHSYLIRYVLSRFPRYSPPRPEVDGKTLRQLNVALLMTFVRQARSDGAVPILAYYPSRSTFNGTAGTEKDSVLADLRAAGVAALDLTECVRAVGVERAFIPEKSHYSRAGNAAVANCLEPEVRRALDRPAP
jgi:hypothetical protein